MIEERKCYSYIISKSFADGYNKINISIFKMIDKELSLQFDFKKQKKKNSEKRGNSNKIN